MPCAGKTAGTELVKILRDQLGTEAGKLSAAVIGSVVPALTQQLIPVIQDTFGVDALVLKSDGRLPLELGYENPSELGPDRIANALAARELHGVPAVVADFGTATTFEVIDRNGKFIGGVIMPGIRTAYAGLFDRVTMFQA